MVEIYALCHPDSKEIRYIGKANNAAKRLSSHMRDSRRRNTPVYCWIRSLNTAPIVVVLETTDENNWKDVERRLISEYRKTHRLLNLADGGDQPFCPPEVRKQNAQKALKSRDPKLLKLKCRLGFALKNGHVSEKTKEFMRSRMDVFGSFARFL